MKYVNTISRKSYLLPIYIIWNGLQTHIEDFLAESKNSFISYYSDIVCKDKTSKKLTEKIFANPHYVQKYFDESMSLSNETRKKSHYLKKLTEHDLSNKELWDETKAVFDLLFESGKTITQARGHAFNYVKKELEKEHSEKFVNDLLMKLTSPTKKSLAIIETEELIGKAIILDDDPTKFNQLIEDHYNDWSWIPTDWAIGTPWSKTDIKNRLIKHIRSGPKKGLLEINKDFLEKHKEKERLLSKYVKSEKLRKLIEMMEIEGFYRLHRRYVLSELLHNGQPLFEEIGFRMKLETNFVYNLLPHEVENFLLNGKHPNKSLVEERSKYFVLQGKGDQISIHYGNEASEMAKILYTDIDETLKILKGNVGCQGKVIGIARVIQSKEDFYKINHGEILVTHETTPDFVPILHKVKGIVTDEGGISCHAAVISREMNIPCIVGTSHGTKIIKDGDKIEINAIDGFVKIIV
jgi:phosphohistidine swiveling domain-containing protein